MQDVLSPEEGTQCKPSIDANRTFHARMVDTRRKFLLAWLQWLNEGGPSHHVAQDELDSTTSALRQLVLLSTPAGPIEP